MVRVKKVLYWHQLGEYLLLNGLTPSECAKVVKEAFPNTNVNGRHIGAYKRRLIEEGKIEKQQPKTMSVNEAYTIAKGLISKEDLFIYKCSVGADKRTLKCYEYKLTKELENDEEDIDEWIRNMVI
tara:strand:- start:19774 stop:20151 length:378 start_codon:yes stop_codon:yes gene_type:complete